jgi:hypothetical protein
MGITIHYHGGLDDPAQLDAALTLLREECARRGWPYRAHDFSARGKFETHSTRSVPSDLPGLEESVVETHTVELNTRWCGLIIQPHHPESESLLLMFDPQTGRLMLLTDGSSGRSLSYYLNIKTQFAPVETHVAVCEVLRRLHDEFGRENLHVSDESGYYETGDLEALLRLRQSIDDALNNPELIARLMRYATAGDEVEPPGAEELTRRLN